MRYYSLALACLVVVCGVSFTLTEYWFGIASSRLISRVRLATYSGMLRAFYYSWEMTLIMIATTPFLVGVNFVRLQQMAGQLNAKKNSDADAAAGSLLSEAIDSIRTVASFGMENSLTAQYTSFLDVSNEQDKALGVSGGVSFGLSQGATFWVLAFVFYIGGIFVSHGTVSFEDLFVVLIVIMMGSFSVSMASQGSVNGKKAK